MAHLFSQVIKAQILAGGRGLGTFTNGLQGGVHIIKTSQVAEYASKMLGGTLVTKQSGPAGKPVNQLLIAKKMDLVNEVKIQHHLLIHFRRT
jgi:succinyl-CoA synthetase beta subunit